MSSKTQELASKSIVSFIGNLIGGVFTILWGILAGRLMGPDIYGEVTYIVTFLTFFTIVTKFGFENSLVYFLSQEQIKDKVQKSILSFCLLVSSIISIFLIILSYLFSDFINIYILNRREYKELLFLLLPTIFLNTLAAVLKSALRGKRKIREAVIAEYIILPVWKVVLLLFLIFICRIKNYYSLVLPIYGSAILSILYSTYHLRKNHMFSWMVKEYQHSKVILFSIPVLFSGFLAVINNNIDKYMLGYIRGASAVAIYDIALQMGAASSIALIAVNTIFAPMISELYHKGEREELKNLYAISTKWITIINFLFFGMFFLFSKEIMHLAGEEYVAGASSLWLIALGQVINAIVGSVGYLNIMTGHPKMELISSITAVMINVMLNYMLIGSYGMVGAALASAVSLAVKNIMNFVFLYKNLRIHPYNKKYLSIFFVLIISMLITYGFSKITIVHYLLKIIVCGIVYCVIYGIGLWKFALNQEEVNMFKNLMIKKK